MAKTFYLVNPAAETPTYFGAEVFEHWGLRPATNIADLAMTTVAALAPADWDISMVDEHSAPVDYDIECDFVGITGKVTQVPGMIRVADEFRRRGRTVIFGGPFASLSPDVVRSHCDVLVIGEIEGIAETLFADLDSGDYLSEYVAERPDLSNSPIPRWDLYKNDRALTGCIQTSRGCPFECEFCDVIVYLGRKQRHKPVENVIAELESLYALGYRQIFLADDNFTAYRKKATAILEALRDWQLEHADDPVGFSTQVSIDVAKDDKVMALLGEAGVTWVFIGIETPNVESLKETHKRQNLGVDLVTQVDRFFEHGIQVTGGMIVGFDNDKHDIFRIQYEFAQRTPIPIFSLGALVAPAATPLHERISAAGRLIEDAPEVQGSPLDTNIVPVNMSGAELRAGLDWLVNKIYSPEAFADRVVQMIERLGPQRGPFRSGRITNRTGRDIDSDVPLMLKKLMRTGKAERRMWLRIYQAMQARPETEPMVMAAMYGYGQVRCVYDAGQLWEPVLAQQPPPFVGAAEGEGGEGQAAVASAGA